MPRTRCHKGNLQLETHQVSESSRTIQNFCYSSQMRHAFDLLKYSLPERMPYDQNLGLDWIIQCAEGAVVL